MLVSQTSFRGESSGDLVKCRLFSQANKLFIVSDRSRCGGYLWHGQYGIYIKSFFRYAFKFVQIQEKPATKNLVFKNLLGLNLPVRPDLHKNPV